MEWTNVVDDKLDFKVLTKVAPTKGNITYEYNPFYNYRVTQNMYEYQGNLYTLGDLWNKFKITLKCKITVKNKDQENIRVEELRNYQGVKFYSIDSITEDDSSTLTETGEIIANAYREGGNLDRLNLENALKAQGKNLTAWWCKLGAISGTDPVLREAGELTDFITDELQFDLEHPVQMLPQYSYDGSVNLILNDGKNSPKLINSRFSATGKNTYEVCDRKGNNDTNIYDQGESFEIDTSLYKQTSKIAKLKFQGVSHGGNLKIGNYHFYFKLSDADGNESDFIAESGLVSIFLGSDSFKSVSTGERDQNARKQVQFQIYNLDSSYDYVHVYYSRYSAENNQNRTIEYIKINKDYRINNSNLANIFITGFEQTTQVSAEDINLQFNVVDSAYTQAICQNRLFMANVHKPDIPYTELEDLSLRILPYLHTETYPLELDYNYNITSIEKGYIDPIYIYNKTGYWTGELYRFGIVYIMPDNTLSPVFNIRGGCSIRDKNTSGQYTQFNMYDSKGNRKYITSDEETYLLISEETKGSCNFENSKGVVMFKSSEDTDKVFSVDMVIPSEVRTELSKYVKGYFFVRQPRVPIVLAQGITIGINKESGTPTIPTKGGIVETIASEDLSKTHVTVGTDDKSTGTSSIPEIVYVSEGFLSRYKFKFKPKGSSIWKQIGKITAIAVAVVAAAAATVFTCGAAGIAIGITASAMAIAAGATIGGAALIPALIAAGQELGQAIRRTRGVSFNRWDTEVPGGYEIEELEDSRKITHDIDKRLILTAADQNYIAGILCPDFELNQPYYNTLFTGNEHLIESTITQGINVSNNQNGIGDNYFSNENGRHFYIPSYTDSLTPRLSLKTKIIGLTDNQKLGCIEDIKFRARAGEAEEAFRIERVGDCYKSQETKITDLEDSETINNEKINSDIVRGSFGPYLGFYDKEGNLRAAETVNIYTSGYDSSKLESYVYQRCCDASTFYTISDRYELNEQQSATIAQDTSDYDIVKTVYRGDCYICQFTHRINRNFQAPSAPFNDQIIDENTWKDNYDPVNHEDTDKINLGDINAVKMGLWATFRVRSSNNLNIRTEDTSNIEEYTMTNLPRSWYPKTPMNVDGVYKIPESQYYNMGFSKLLGERYNFEMPDIPWIKNWFKTRIMYSNINVSDSFQNGFRVFKGQNYRDYTREYGEITKLISLESNLLCVFEHGVALIPVNERAIAAEGAGGMAYINTSNVLPENPKILSDIYGSQWADSVIKVPGKFGNNIQYVYGVDTVAKKIWMTDGNTLTCISDGRVQEFLNNNISLSQQELTPKIGIRNVKTFYNSFKRDVLFTFYDNTYGFEEKVWNLCWNELLQQFVTFYSWVPSVMENINNIPFSFNRDTSKWLAKLGTSHSDNSFADGITLSNNIINNTYDTNYSISDIDTYQYTYQDKEGKDITVYSKVPLEARKYLVGILSLSNRTLPTMNALPKITYSIERDISGNYNKFYIDKVKTINLPDNAKFAGQNITIYGLYYGKENQTSNPKLEDLMSELYYRNENGNIGPDSNEGHKISIYNDNGEVKSNYFTECIQNKYPIFKQANGLRPTLDKPYNKENIVTLLNIKANITYITEGNTNISEEFNNIEAGLKPGSQLIDAGYYESVVAVIPKWNLSLLSTDFWRHGQAGIFDITDKIYPTNWFGEQHPFEFEFIVADNPGKHKIFDSLQLISNKATPESFHYEIIGECYDFAKDKKNMYIRQEATKELYQYNEADTVYDHKYNELVEEHRLLGNGICEKSTIFPLYYGRQDRMNEIQDYYYRKKKDGCDLSALAGAELIFYRNLNEIAIRNNCEAIDITNPEKGRLRGNMQYKEGIWDIQINPINYAQTNENNWETAYGATSNLIPVEINNFAIPDKIKSKESLELPTSDTFKGRGLTIWDSNKTVHGEVKIKDKYLKVRIRYDGKDLAIINAINTLYSISYA